SNRTPRPSSRSVAAPGIAGASSRFGAGSRFSAGFGCRATPASAGLTGFSALFWTCMTPHWPGGGRAGGRPAQPARFPPYAWPLAPIPGLLLQRGLLQELQHRHLVSPERGGRIFTAQGVRGRWRQGYGEFLLIFPQQPRVHVVLPGDVAGVAEAFGHGID